MNWEERMAAKAHQRVYERTAKECCIMRAEYEAEQEILVSQYAATLTPESAAAEQREVDANPVGCACIGGPLCCIVRAKARKRVLE